MAERMHLVRYYYHGSYYREVVPEYDLDAIQSALKRADDGALDSITYIGIDPEVKKPRYNNCMPCMLPGKGAVVDRPEQKTRFEQLREKTIDELAQFLCNVRSGNGGECVGCLAWDLCHTGHTGWSDWLMSVGVLGAEEDNDIISRATENHEGITKATSTERFKSHKLSVGLTMTNADFIRSLSDEELAEVIMCPRENGAQMDACVGKSCVECCLDWIKQLREV